MKFAGKTGTAQVKKITKYERDRDLKNKDFVSKIIITKYLISATYRISTRFETISS